MSEQKNNGNVSIDGLLARISDLDQRGIDVSGYSSFLQGFDPANHSDPDKVLGRVYRKLDEISKAAEHELYFIEDRTVLEDTLSGKKDENPAETARYNELQRKANELQRYSILKRMKTRLISADMQNIDNAEVAIQEKGEEGFRKLRYDIADFISEVGSTMESCMDYTLDTAWYVREVIEDDETRENFVESLRRINKSYAALNDSLLNAITPIGKRLGIATREDVDEIVSEYAENKAEADEYKTTGTDIDSEMDSLVEDYRPFLGSLSEHAEEYQGEQTEGILTGAEVDSLLPEGYKTENDIPELEPVGEGPGKASGIEYPLTEEPIPLIRGQSEEEELTQGDIDALLGLISEDNSSAGPEPAGEEPGEASGVEYPLAGEPSSPITDQSGNQGADDRYSRLEGLYRDTLTEIQGIREQAELDRQGYSNRISELEGRLDGEIGELRQAVEESRYPERPITDIPIPEIQVLDESQLFPREGEPAEEEATAMNELRCYLKKSESGEDSVESHWNRVRKFGAGVVPHSNNYVRGMISVLTDLLTKGALEVAGLPQDDPMRERLQSYQTSVQEIAGSIRHMDN